MARPVSIAGLQALSTTTAAPPKCQTPTVAEIFVTNLRLLDLDLRQDWPAITARTFSTKDAQQNQKQRTRCTEWALYRLFEIWDPEETREKLRPFFPPLEPLQSLNLRAALFRALNDLKKNGVLGRETILRKTMLDECRGDKLMEVLVVFSTAVARRSDLAQTEAGAPVANTLSTATMLSAVQQGSLIPLSIACSASITARLRKKEEKAARFHQFDEVLQSKSSQLKERLNVCNAFEHPAIDDAEEHHIKQVLHDNWHGNSKWPQVVLYGDESNPGDLPLQRPFDQVWHAVAEGGQLLFEPDRVGLLESLERRVNEQSYRLRKWHNFHDTFFRDVVAPRAPQSKPRFDFGKHKEIRLGTNTPIDPSCPWPQSAQTYQTVLSALRIDLLNASRCRRERHGNANPVPEHAIFSPLKVQPITARSRARTGSGGAVIVGQVGLKSLSLTNKHMLLNKPQFRRPSPPESFSPIERMESPSHEIHAKPGPVFQTPEITLESEQSGSERSSSVISPAQERHGSTDEASPSFSSDDGDPILPESTPNQADAIISSIVDASPSPLKPLTLSLTDRTRISMAATKQPNFKPQLLQPSPAPIPEEPPVPGIEIHNRRASLLERTRQSMAYIPAQPRSKKSSRKSNRQSLFPVNQFETPGKPRASSGELKRDATPTEKLFSEDAEYTSVFKSRPRIALSPITSPGDAKLLELQEEDETESDDDYGERLGYMGSSPLAGRTGIAN
ncbi:hypothetical protein EJ08DRAFT_658104 [Tothia fuscella]|uniref:HAUS augmin-like complex subunit 6 N-terminal domain-containing protein n=1 Tax=Tothia fuscella TaxID=1048955 RepID=A0A9P4NWF2_9PEZI|nr:hypothetical protein EJ08DRAFT_658104 [Tothia fuscella]